MAWAEIAKMASEVAKEGDNNGHDGNGGANLFDTFDKMLNAYRDSQTTEMLKAIINTFNKKTNSGNGCTGYSGVFNPRNIRNNDYKYFDRNINAKGNNKYGKFHLNLFIDESGVLKSYTILYFCPDMTLRNRCISALRLQEKNWHLIQDLYSL